MRKLFFSILSILLMSTSGYSQSHQLNIGIHGGVTSSLSREVPSRLGPEAIFDIGYTIYGPIGYKADLGFHLGVSLGYSGYGWHDERPISFSNVDYLGNQMDYTITSSSVVQRVQQLQMEVPLQLAFRAHGFVLNAGVKLKTPEVWNRYTQHVSGMSIAAYYPAFGVTVTDELITGLPTEEQLHQSGRLNLPVLSIAAAVNIGYEWQRGLHGLGMGLYVDYGFAEISTTNAKLNRLVDVSPISNPAYPVPVVTIHPISSLMSSIPQTFSVGLSVYYTFSSKQKYRMRFPPRNYYHAPRRTHRRR